MFHSAQVIEDADQVLVDWQVPKESNFTRAPMGDVHSSNVVTFETTLRYESAIVLSLDHVLDLVLGIDLNLKMNSSFSVTVQSRETQKTYRLHYIVADIMINVQVRVLLIWLFTIQKLIFLFIKKKNVLG